MKTAIQYLEEAEAIVDRISTEDAITQINETGTIAGAIHISRGMIEFEADETHSLHHPTMEKNKKVVLICGAGGQAALAGKTLKDMGYVDVVNAGAFPDWQKAGGPTENI